MGTVQLRVYWDGSCLGWELFGMAVVLWYLPDGSYPRERFPDESCLGGSCLKAHIKNITHKTCRKNIRTVDVIREIFIIGYL